MQIFKKMKNREFRAAAWMNLKLATNAGTMAAGTIYTAQSILLGRSKIEIFAGIGITTAGYLFAARDIRAWRNRNLTPNDRHPS